MSAPTPEQQAAADPSRSVWVTANAGTGKTRVLTDRLLRLLLAGAEPQGILCITFTRAAAAEMTARIERRLATWAIAHEDQVRQELEELLGGPPPPAMVVRARRLFAEVLELPQGLQIQTIHAFCAAVLRRFPLEAGIPPHFETADEATQRELFAEAREQVLREAAEGRDPQLAEALRTLVSQRGDRHLYDSLHALLAQRGRLQQARAHHGSLAGLIAAVAKALSLEPDASSEALLEATCCEGAFDRPALARLVAAWREGGVNQRKAADALGAWLAASPAERAIRWRSLAGTVFTKEWQAKSSVVSSRFRRQHPDLAAVYDRELQRWQAFLAAYYPRVLLEETAAWLRLGEAILERYETLKKREGLLDFDDLIRHTVRLFERGIDWVLYKLDARIHHILVDEAQDTSPEQWRVIEALLAEIFAGAGQHEDGSRTLFVVGDEKQSIYSFQGADLKGFREVRRRIEERARKARHPFRTTALTRSFRSLPAILTVVDHLFNHQPEARTGVLDEGERLHHEPHRQDGCGQVVLWPLLHTPRPRQEEPWPLPEPTPPADPEPRLADAVARTIRRWLERGEQLENGDLLTPGDVLILVRRRGVIQELVVRALQRQGVPVAGVDRMRLEDHLAVRDLLALGHAVLLPEDDYSLACVLLSPLFGLDHDDLFALAAGREGLSLHERLRHLAETADEPRRTRLRQALARFERWRARADYVPPYEWYAWILGAEGGRRQLLERLGVDAAEPIEAFLAKTLQFEEGHASSLQGFLHWFELGAGELSRDPEKGGGTVRVTTVHGAKGLEAPVVFLLDAGPRQPPPERDPLIWARNQAGGPPLPFARRPRATCPPQVTALLEAEARAREEEENRLLYVALTRAGERLIIAGWGGAQISEDAKTSCWHGLIARTLEALGAERQPFPFAQGEEEQEMWLFRPQGQPRRRESPAATEERAEAVVALPSWVHQPAPAEPAEDIPLPASRAVAEEDEDEARVLPGPLGRRELEGRLWRGRALHLLLQYLPGVPRARWQEVAARLLASHPASARAIRGEDGARPDVAQLVAEVARVVDHPAIAAVFDPTARAEQPLAGWVEGRPVMGRVDRFLVDRERVLLVDFKTHPDPPASLPGDILTQMRRYAAILRGIYPGRRIQAAVVWTAIPRVDPIPPEELRS